MPSLPHPIPYQGSKRKLAPQILSVIGNRKFNRAYDPFVGSAGFTIAAVDAGIADKYVLGDIFEPLAFIWCQILSQPKKLTDAYEKIWLEQFEDSTAHYYRVRDEFNYDGSTAKLLYLLVRCVLNAPRFNESGAFNQGVYKRRHGTHPDRMRKEILAAHQMLWQKAVCVAGDFERTIVLANADDLVYLDPPYAGVSGKGQHTYYQCLDRDRLLSVLNNLNKRHVPWILSYDGKTGERQSMDYLTIPSAQHILLRSTRSAQSAILGRNETTFESLYVSDNLFGG